MNAEQISAEAGRMGRRAGRKAKHSDTLDHAVRLGLIAYGVVHLLIAYLAGQLVFGHHSGSPSGTGALSQLAGQPFGQILLWIIGVGFFALVVWQLTEALLGHRDQDGMKRLFARLGSAGKAVVYGVLGFSALKLAVGGGSSGSGTDTMTARLMSLPAGPVLVGVVAAVILAIAAGHVYTGLTVDFRDKMKLKGNTGLSGRINVGLGMAGYVTKGLALSIVAALFGYAAGTHDPQKSGGLDQALKSLLDEPFGAPLLLLIALGLACYGLFCFAWARHLDR